MKKIIYFTTSFPYGLGEQWKATELEILVKHFDLVVVAPLAYNGNTCAVKLHKNIRVLSPIFQQDSPKSNMLNVIDLLKLFFHKPVFLYRIFFELSKMRAFSHIKALLIDYLKVSQIFSSHYFQKHVQTEFHDALLYFFWGKGYVDILPFIDCKFQNISFVRFHGYDLYDERNNGYVPNQKSIVRAASHLITISKHGYQHLEYKYPRWKEKVFISPLGTTEMSRSTASNDGTLRIVTCAFVSPVKRLHLLAQALYHVQGRVIWTHIGGGMGLDNLVRLTNNLPRNIQAHFTGNLSSDEVQKVYAENSFDVFISVSFSEGIPVSIMEALSAGVPVIATDVGGTCEVVDENVGIVLARDIGYLDVAKSINQFKSFSSNVIQQYRSACIKRYNTRLVAEVHAEKLALKLSSYL